MDPLLEKRFAKQRAKEAAEDEGAEDVQQQPLLKDPPTSKALGKTASPCRAASRLADPMLEKKFAKQRAKEAGLPSEVGHISTVGSLADQSTKYEPILERRLAEQRQKALRADSGELVGELPREGGDRSVSSPGKPTSPQTAMVDVKLEKFMARQREKVDNGGASTIGDVGSVAERSAGADSELAARLERRRRRDEDTPSPEVEEAEDGDVADDTVEAPPAEELPQEVPALPMQEQPPLEVQHQEEKKKKEVGEVSIAEVEECAEDAQASGSLSPVRSRGLFARLGRALRRICGARG